jgi:serine/threonine protein kinase
VDYCVKERRLTQGSRGSRGFRGVLRSVDFPSRSTSLHTDAAGTPPPDAFGPFRVLHQIGAGALGPVFRAYDPEQEKLVAVKWFRLDLPPERTHRLVAELEQLIASDLSHSAIATPLATGIVNAAAYLAHDFVTADSVDIVIREHGAVPPAEAVRIATHLAGALDAAADAKIAHGALHPRDVLVSADDVRVTGLGIARALEQAGSAVPTRRPYTAPERAAGTAIWDRRADVFSLAVLVHEWLWAKRVTVLGRRAADALTELPGADLAALRRLFMRALAEKPDDRFDSAHQFAEELTHALAAAPSLKSHISSRRPLEPRLPLHGSMESAMPAEVVEQPVTGGAKASARHDDAQFPVQLRQSGPSNLGIGAADMSGDSDLVIAPVTARAPRRVPASEPAFRFTESESQVVQDNRGPLPAARSRFENVNGALDPTGSAVWPLGLALVLGVSLGFAAGYEVASWQRRPGAALAAAAGPAPAAQATSGGSAREFTESAVREPPAAATPGTDVSLTANAAKTALPSAGVRSAAAIPAAAGRLLIRSTPAGARVLLDGHDVGETPVTLRDVARGAHTVRVVRDGYIPAQRRVVVSAAGPPQSLTIALGRARAAAAALLTPSRPARSVAALNVESRPAGASVFLDGKLIGRTPLQVGEVAAGDHTVRIELDGYRRWSSSVRVVAGERGRVAASLDR